MKRVILPKNTRKRLISSLMSSRPTTPKSNENFLLKGTSEFTSRSANIFGELTTLEEAHETWISENPAEDIILKTEKESENNYNESHASTSTVKLQSFNLDFKSKIDKTASDDFIFKKPKLTKIQKRSRAISSFWKPHKKWTKYSLEDVPLSSNATNTAVALSFINDLRKQKAVKLEEDSTNEKIIFTKPNPKKNYKKSKVENLSSKNTVAKDSASQSNKVRSIVKLSHLDTEN